jgi:16S rRNA (guanine966-N2)-methyltransferase
MFDSPGSHRTHPMSDKMRGALFNILGDLGGLNVLDAFGGSGALGFEAISRGAHTVLILDDDTTAQKTIEQNIGTLKLEPSVRLVRMAAGGWLRKNPGKVFDVVLCDPPYDNVQHELIEKLAKRVSPGGILVLSHPTHHELPRFMPILQIKQQSYGDAQLVFYRS